MPIEPTSINWFYKPSYFLLAELNIVWIFGAGKEIRTPDPNLGKVVLYH
jgi:hypothetical protein